MMNSMKAIWVVLILATEALCWGQEPRVYWTDKDDGQLESADLDGGNRVTILSGQADPRGIVVDRLTGKIYWAIHETNGAIWSADLDGTNVVVFQGGLSEPADLALDRFSRTLYWAEEGANLIRRRSLDHEESPQLVIEGLNRPYYLAVDPLEGLLYWSDFNSTNIHRSTMDGANSVNFITGQSRVRDVEVFNGVLYWCDRNSSQLRSRALDGVGNGTILFSGTGLDRPHGLVLDPDENTMYWTDTATDTVSSGSMTGGTLTAIASTSLAGAWAIDIWRPQVEPHQEWLEENFTSEELNNAGLEATVWGWNADPDGDGRLNLLEYAQGTDPQINLESSELNQVFVEGGELQIKFRFRRNDPALQFEVESTFDLSAASWDAGEFIDEIIRTPDPSDPRFEFVQVESDTISDLIPKLFARLKVFR